MSWRKTSPMLERKSFVKTVRNGLMNVSEACRYFGVSRTCGYKWLERYGLEGEVERPEGGLDPWQRAFDNFRHTYNHERPHEALDIKPPASVYTSSARPYQAKEPEVEYPQGYTIRRVRSNGEIKWGGRKIYCSQTLVGEPVGLIRTSEEFWDIYYGKLKVGKLDERTGKIYRPSRT